MKKINLKARFKRQSRIVKDKKDFGIKKSNLHTNSIFSIIFIFLVFLFPIYPSIASYIKGDSKYDFYRGNIDKSSIMESFDARDFEDADLFSSGDEYISVNVPLEDDRDTSGMNEIIEYSVEEGETVASIAEKFQIKKSSILELNKKYNKVAIKPGDKLRILPVAGVLYTIRPGDHLSTISRKFNISEEKIKNQNFKSGEVRLIAGKQIIIPGAKPYVKPKPKPKKKVEIKNIKKKTVKKPEYKKPVKKKKTYKKKTYKKKKVYKKKTYQKYKKIVARSGYYRLRKRRAFSGVPGNCTRYVASHKSVNWRGNANRWLYNAAAKGRKVYRGRRVTPNPGFIVVFNGRGYNPRYGHVGIVMSVNRKAGTMVVSDMNYAGLRRITYRTMKLNHRAIRGYIDIP